MNWNTNTDPGAFLAGLQFAADVRQTPNNGHRGQFRHQWRRGARGEGMRAKTLETLTWANLGFRGGSAFGSMSDEMIDDAFESFAILYRDTARQQHGPY